jgi:hypothetical protein
MDPEQKQRFREAVSGESRAFSVPLRAVSLQKRSGSAR